MIVISRCYAPHLIRRCHVGGVGGAVSCGLKKKLVIFLEELEARGKAFNGRGGTLLCYAGRSVIKIFSEVSQEYELASFLEDLARGLNLWKQEVVTKINITYPSTKAPPSSLPCYLCI